jgi:hypothetical protein
VAGAFGAIDPNIYQSKKLANKLCRKIVSVFTCVVFSSSFQDEW